MIGEKMAESILDKFGIDVTKRAEKGELDPCIGREKEIERMSIIISRRKKNNVVLIGEPGVGKTALVEGFAQAIVNKKVRRNLLDKKVFYLDIASIVAGTKYRGEFEERMKIIVDEIEKRDDIILFIDEIHTMVGAGSTSGSLDASNILKPSLARGTVQCIGSTTLDEYRKYIEKDGALERRFQKLIVEPPSEEESINILKNLKEKYEDYHAVKYTDKAIEACVKLTNRYITDRSLPDKAIDAMDEAGSKVHIGNIKVPKKILNIEEKIEDVKTKKQETIKKQLFEESAKYRDQERELQIELKTAKDEWEKKSKKDKITVDYDVITDVVSLMSGVPVTSISENESEKLLNIENALQKAVIGQDEAIVEIAKSIRRNRSGLKDPNRPIGTFLFLGNSGVGKTYLAKMLAKYMFDSEENLIRFDMSEYMEKHSVSRLIGAPPGYVGYDEGGQLTEKVRRKPYSIVLFDEIEKAHPDVYNIFLQVFDEGVLTDNNGNRVDFKNTIIIMTSNIGTRKLKDFGTGVGFSTPSLEQNKGEIQKGIIESSLRKSFSPELINRIDNVLIFNQLEKENIIKILDIEIDKLINRALNNGYKILLTDSFKNFVIEDGYDANYGARHLKRSIQKNVEDVIAEEVIRNPIIQSIMLDYVDGKTKIETIIKN